MKTLLFDFDNTICNTNSCTLDGLRRCYNRFFKEQKFSEEAFIQANRKAFEEIYSVEKVLAHRASILIWYRMFDKLCIDKDDLRIYLMYRFLHRYISENIQLNSGFNEIIMFAKRNKIQVGILSNGSFLEVMGKFKRLKLFEHGIRVFTADIIGYEKPDRNAFKYVCQALKCSLVQTVFIGDSLTTDIKGALDAKLHTILYNPSGVDERLSKQRHIYKPHHEIRDLTEIVNMIGAGIIF